MKILLDECLPRRIKSLLEKFEVKTVSEMGWKSLRNGQLMHVAFEQGFDILLTIDKNLEYQQNVKNYSLAIIVFDVPRNKIEFIAPLLPKFIQEISQYQAGKVYRIR